MATAILLWIAFKEMSAPVFVQQTVSDGEGEQHSSNNLTVF